nr:condensation domain-containing protein [uncultured bacterium]
MNNFDQEISKLSPAQLESLAQRLVTRARGRATKGTIPRRDDPTAAAPLSFAQQRLWFLNQLEPDTSTYNLPAAIQLSGRLDVTAMERALSEVVRRHETLRTRFEVREGEPVQVIEPPQPLRLQVTDLTHLPEGRREAEAWRLSQEEAERPFNLSSGPLLRSELLRLGAEEHVLLLTMHHVVSDGWSMGVLVREVAALYEAYSQGRTAALPELAVQYSDFAVWQRGWLEGEVLERQLSYWRQQLRELPPLLELPTDGLRPPVQSFQGASRRFWLSESVTREVRGLSRAEGVTLFMVLLAAFKVLLLRYTGQSDIWVGTPVANRTRVETEALIGFFVNTLVLRTDLDGDPTFMEVLARVRRTCLEAYTHQDLPFERLVEELQPDRDLSRSPLFQVMFAWEEAAAVKLPELPGLVSRPWKRHRSISNFDMTFTPFDGGSRLGLEVEYSTDLFEAATIERITEHYERLLESIVTNPKVAVSRLALLSRKEEQLLVAWNETKREYPPGAGMHRLFEAQVERRPLAVALVTGSERLTYQELNERANRLAKHLVGLGVGAEDRVGILLERSAVMVDALLGVLKAGGCYVPLDTEYPRERLAFMMEDAGLKVLLTTRQLAESLSLAESAQRLVFVDGAWEEPESGSHPQVEVSEHQLAYLIYTSGSTGRPKAVAIEHGSATTFIHWASEIFDEQTLSGVLFCTSICFDLSIFELFVTLSRGGKVILAGNALELAVLPAAAEVTLINTVPSAMVELVRKGVVPKTVRVVNLAGEALSQELVAEIYASTQVERVYNLYGPSEDTTYSTFTLVSRGERVTIGRPVANTRAYVLDQYGQPVPVGVVGELYVGGAKLARGYWERVELTAEKFIPDGFSEQRGARLYRTGDQARYLANGELEFLGRRDQQVKVRGYRIELGEIESVMRRHEQVREAVVVARERGVQEQQLVAYVVVGDGVQVSELREWLGERLPEYMTPTAWVQLEELPLTPNGKIDRKRLPAPELERERLEQSYKAPRTQIEEVVLRIWQAVLRVEQIGIHDNFFELGGHSLLATQVVWRVGQTLGVELPIRTLFEAPTVAELSREAEQALLNETAGAGPPITRVERRDALPLSFAQQRLWFLQQLDPESGAYNIPVGVRLTGSLHVEVLERSLAEVVRQHESLRTRFEVREGEPVQVIEPPQPLRLPVSDLTHLPEGQREAEAWRLSQEEAERPFNLSSGPLLRSELLRLGAEEHVLLLTMHHVVSDGWSMGVLVREVAALYEAYSQGRTAALPELAVQYSDFAVWQRGWLEGEVLERQLSYWRQQLRELPPLLELPTDGVRPPVQSFQGASRRFWLSESVTREVRELSRAEGVSLFMVLLAAFKVLLLRYTGQSDIWVGTPVANRTRVETEALIGFFVNTLVLRTDLGGDPTFMEVLARVRRTCLEAYAHQDLPFERLVEELQPDRDLSRSPLFQVMFAWQEAAVVELPELPGLVLQPWRRHRSISNFDMTFTPFDGGSRLGLEVEYSTDLFEAATIERMMRHWTMLLEGVVADATQRISRLPLLTSAEQQELLVEWNDTGTSYPRDLCIHELFEQQTEGDSQAVALISGDVQVSYGELNARANQLAHYLRELGVGPDTLVGVMVERSVDIRKRWR